MPETIPSNNVIDESLQNIPFFRTLSPETLHEISAKMQFVRLEHGQIVFAEGSLGDAMYLIESGQVKVSISTGNGQREKIINHLGPGNFFGEMALILDQRRSATVSVTIDVDLWVLHKSDLDELLVENPEIALQITRELSRRLSDTVSEMPQRTGFRLSVIFGNEAWRVAESIHGLTQQRVVVFNVTGQPLTSQLVPDRLSDDLAILEAPENLTSDVLVETLGILADAYDWVLVALPLQYSPVRAKAVQIAGAAILLNLAPQPWIADLCSGPQFLCDGTQESIDRTARKITHRVVGLALSSGGARGIAHIGVLEVLEEAHFPIDMIAGTSAGSLFGALYAAGKSVEEIADFARSLINQIKLKSGLWDPKFSLPWNGLIKGGATAKYLARQFNDASFADTRIPFYVVAADVLTGEEVVFDTGPLAEAVRASIGMIGIFAPYELDNHYLIDGGAVNPVPASVLAERGANVIVACSVIPSLEEERIRAQVTEHSYHRPNFLGVLSNMMSIMEREIVKTRMSPVDVLIKPKVEVYTAMDYDKADYFLELGRQAARQNLPLLKKALYGVNAI